MNEKKEPYVEISKRLVLINSISSVITRLINIFFLVWIYEYLLERISAEEFAVYPVVAAIIVFAPLFSSLMTGGISRYVIEAYARGEMQRVTEIVSSIVPLLAMAALAFLGLGLVFSWYIDQVLTIPGDRLWDARIMMALLVAGFALQTFLLPYGVAFDVKQRYVLLNMIYISRDLLRIAVLFVLLLGVSVSVLWVVVATVGANATSFVLITWLSRRMLPQLRFKASLFRWQTARQLFSFGVWTTLGQMAFMIHSGAGAIVLNKLGTALDVTSYHIGSMFDRQVSVMATVASSPVQPALTAMHSTGDQRRLGNAFVRGGRYALWASLAVACPLVVFSAEFITLYIGDRYLRTATVIVLLMSTYPFLYANHMLPKIAVAKARIRAFFIAAFAQQFIILLLMIYLTGWRELGAVGVAFSSFIIVIIWEVAIFWPMGLRMAKVPFKRFLNETLRPGLMPSITGLLIWWALKSYHAPETWFQLIAYVLMGHAAYGFVLIKYCLQSHERQELTLVFRKIGIVSR